MAQIKTKFITDKAVTAPKLGSGAATSSQPFFADGSGGAAYRSIVSGDVPTLNQNTTGTASNVTATSNATLTTLSALTTASSLASVGTITSGTWNGTTIAIANGGTGQTSASSAFNALSPMTTAGDIIYENSSPAAARLPIGSSGQVLTVVGGLPAWAAPTVSPSSISLTQNHILVGNASNLAADVAMSGEASIVASGAITLSNAAVIAKVLTGYTPGAGTVTSSDSILSAIEKLDGNDSLYLPLAGGTMSGTIDLGGFVPINSSTPINPNDLVNKSYVDNFINATSWKTAVHAASVANIDLSVAADPNPVDGVTLADGDRVLLKAQSAPAENGIYIAVTAVDPTTWTRSSDMSTWAEVPAAAVFVESGTVNADIGWVCTSQPGGTLGTTAITFVQFSSAGAYSADEVTLHLASGVFSVKTGGISNTQVNAAAAIAYSKLNLSASIVNADIAAGAAIVYSKLSLAASIKASDQNSQAATSGQVLTANGSGGATYADPAVSSVNGQTGIVSLALDDLSDVTAPSPSSGDVLTWNGSAWINSPTAATSTVTEDIITLSPTDITNQYVDLAHAATGSSASINSLSLNVVGGPEQLKAVDYTVSLTGGSGGVTRVTFAGDLATGGPAALVSGDILMIKYAY